MEEAVQAHRAADVEQQHEARTYATAILPRQPERRASAAHAAAYRALQVEAAAAREPHLAPQLQVLDATCEATHQRPDVAQPVGAKEIAEIGGRKRLLATRAMTFG